MTVLKQDTVSRLNITEFSCVTLQQRRLFFACPQPVNDGQWHTAYIKRRANLISCVMYAVVKLQATQNSRLLPAMRSVERVACNFLNVSFSYFF